MSGDSWVTTLKVPQTSRTEGGRGRTGAHANDEEEHLGPVIALMEVVECCFHKLSSSSRDISLERMRRFCSSLGKAVLPAAS